MATAIWRTAHGSSAPAAPAEIVSASPLQTRAAVRQARDHAVRLNQRGGRPGLPAQLQAGIERLSGLAMDDVRVHYGSSRPAPLGAEAFAQGSDIHLAPGKEHHLPHEAWHVAQQKQGRVRATTQVGGMPVNNDAGLESEADTMGARALRAPAAEQPVTAPAQLARATVHQLEVDPKIAKLRADVADKGTEEMQAEIAAFLAGTGRGGSPSSGGAVQKKQAPATPPRRNPETGGTVQRAVAQLYTAGGYVPNLAGLTVPVHATDGAAFNYTARPAGWYDGTFDALVLLAQTRMGRGGMEVYCPLVQRWFPRNVMQIGHKQKWAPYIRSKGPANRREGINAYNDLANLRLESPDANQSHDFEEYDEINAEGYDLTDPFLEDAGEMDAHTRRELDLVVAQYRRPRLTIDRQDRLRRRNLMDRVEEYARENIVASLIAAGLLAAFLMWLVMRLWP